MTIVKRERWFDMRAFSGAYLNAKPPPSQPAGASSALRFDCEVMGGGKSRTGLCSALAVEQFPARRHHSISAARQRIDEVLLHGVPVGHRKARAPVIRSRWKSTPGRWKLVEWIGDIPSGRAIGV